MCRWKCPNILLPRSLSLSHVSHTNIPRELPPPASALCCCHCPQPPQPPSTASPLRVVRGLGHQARRMPAALLLRLGRTSHPISSTGRVGHRQLPAPWCLTWPADGLCQHTRPTPATTHPSSCNHMRPPSLMMPTSLLCHRVWSPSPTVSPPPRRPTTARSSLSSLSLSLHVKLGYEFELGYENKMSLICWTRFELGYEKFG
jgi:hypothetical protein